MVNKLGVIGVFYHYSPVKILNGIGALEAMHREILPSSKILVLHGRSFCNHKSITFGLIRQFLSDFKVEFSLIPDGDPSVFGLASFVTNNLSRPDFILAIGGGRVIDFAKAFALSHTPETALNITSMDWKEHSKSIPLGVVVTRPGSGSEGNNAWIVSDKLGFKRSSFSLQSYPKFCVHDPRSFEGLSGADFSLGLFDGFMHVVDQYCADRDRAAVVDEMALCFSKILGELAGRAIQLDVYDFQQLAWVSSLISSSILSRGVKTSWKFHQLAHAVDSRIGLGHGISLMAVAQKVYEIGAVDQARCSLLIENFSLGYGKKLRSFDELIFEIAPDVANSLSDRIKDSRITISEIEEACPDFDIQELVQVI